jgi:hypothetical protein
MLALLAIFYFTIISYFLLLDDPLKNEQKFFWGFFGFFFFLWIFYSIS